MYLAASPSSGPHCLWGMFLVMRLNCVKKPSHWLWHECVGLALVTHRWHTGDTQMSRPEYKQYLQGEDKHWLTTYHRCTTMTCSQTPVSGQFWCLLPRWLQTWRTTMSTERCSRATHLLDVVQGLVGREAAWEDAWGHGAEDYKPTSTTFYAEITWNWFCVRCWWVCSCLSNVQLTFECHHDGLLSLKCFKANVLSVPERITKRRRL